MRYSGDRMRRLLLIPIMFLFCLLPISSNFELEVIPADTPILLVPADVHTEYIDAVQSTTYGTITNAPPSGMGTSDLNNRTTLTEASYIIDNPSPVLLETADFASGLPSGWSETDWTVASGVAYADSSEVRVITTKAYDLSSYYKVRLDFDYASYDTNYIESGDYRVAIKVDASTYEYTTIPGRTSTTVTAMTTIDEYTTYNAVTVAWQDVNAANAERLKIDNVDVYGVGSLTRYRFQSVFCFDAVQLGFDVYVLYVVFNASLSGSDDLDFYFEAGDTTPDNLVADDKQNSFTVDVTAYVTGTTCYLSILDDYRDNDATQTSMYISAIYLYTYIPVWHIIESEMQVWFETPQWNNIITAILRFLPPHVYMGHVDALLIFLGLFMIPASTIYLVKGGKDDMSTNKLFYFLIAFLLGWGLLLGGIFA